MINDPTIAAARCTCRHHRYDHVTNPDDDGRIPCCVCDCVDYERPLTLVCRLSAHHEELLREEHVRTEYWIKRALEAETREIAAREAVRDDV